MSFDYDSDVFDELLDQLNDARMLEIDCPECNHPIEVSLDNVGDTIKCPKCGIEIKLESE